MINEQDMQISAAYSIELDAPRVSTLESDFYSTIVPREYADWDLSLYATKWFDYRMMTPLQATKAYIEAYKIAYQRIYAREFDRNRAEFIKPIDFEKLRVGIHKGVTKDKTRFVGCWHGRQIADFLCMPYLEYIELTMGFRMRRWKQGFMPQPQHLYHEYDVEKTQNRWGEMMLGRLYTAEHSVYLVQNYQDLPHQNAYHEYLFEMAKSRSNPAMVLAEVINKDQMPYEKVLNRVGAEMFERVERYLS